MNAIKIDYDMTEESIDINVDNITFVTMTVIRYETWRTKFCAVVYFKNSDFPIYFDINLFALLKNNEMFDIYSTPDSSIIKILVNKKLIKCMSKINENGKEYMRIDFVGDSGISCCVRNKECKEESKHEDEARLNNENFRLKDENNRLKDENNRLKQNLKKIRDLL